MIEFTTIQKEKIAHYQAYYDDPAAVGCEGNFVSGWLWNEAFKLRVAERDNTLIKAYFRDERRVWGYCLPRGEHVREAVEAVLHDAAERGQPVRFAYMTADEREQLEALYPGRFRFEEEPDNCDYIYLSRDLATLAGKKYHAKRNHISRFYRTYADRTCFQTLDGGSLGDVMTVMRQWCDENGFDPAAYGEYAVMQAACDSFSELGLQGALLYVERKPVAMTMGVPLSASCFDVMFEKALREYDGVYAVINNEFAKTLTRYTYINREEDMGLEGLRKAKLSYHPAMIYDRFSAFEK